MERNELQNSIQQFPEMEGMNSDGTCFDLDMPVEDISDDAQNLEYFIILQNIRERLTGEGEKDIPILKKQMDKYKSHPMGSEIIKALARMLYEYMSDETKAELNDAIEKDNATHATQLQQIRELYSERKIEEAIALAEELASKADQNPMFREDAVSKYFNFHEWMEELAYKLVSDEKKECRLAQYPYDEIYSLLGVLYVEQKELEKARGVLSKALEWNPVDADTAFEYTETFKMEGNMEEFLRETRRISKFVFREKDVARVLRNLGFYCIEKKHFEDALACYMYSLLFDKESAMAKSEIKGICTYTALEPEYPDHDKCRQLAERYQISVGPDSDLLQMIYSAGMYCKENDRRDDANYCFKILYALTDDEDIQKLIEDKEPETQDFECRIETARPMTDTQYKQLVLLVKSLAGESVLLSFTNYIEDDEIISIQISKAANGFNMSLAYDMSAFDWEKPLVLGAEDIPDEIAMDILRKLALAETNSDHIDYIFNHFKSIGG